MRQFLLCRCLKVDLVQMGIETSFEPTLYIGDSANMHFLEDNSVNLIVTSPPYFNVKDYNKDGHQDKVHSQKVNGQIGDLADYDEFIEALSRVWLECERVLTPNGKLVINVPMMPMLKKEFNSHESRHIFDLNASIQNSILCNSEEMYLLDTYIWKRTNSTKNLMFGSYPYPPNFYAQNTIEFVTVYVKAGKPAKKDAQTKDASRLTKDEWVEFTKQVWEIPIPNKSDLAWGAHSAIMPEEIVKRCVRLYSFVGDVVLDPFAGSGTTLRVANSLNRHAVGVELMKKYASVAAKKVDGLRILVPTDVEKDPASTAIPGELINTVSVSDCFSFLDKIPEQSIDLICVDPPYNLSIASWDTFATERDFLRFTEKWIRKAIPKLRIGGSFYVFNTPRNSALILPILENLGMEYRNWITWHKKDGFSTTKRQFRKEQESILFFTKPGKRHLFNADEVRVPYESSERIQAATKTGILKNGKRWFPNPSGRMSGDVWHFPSDRHGAKVAGKIVKPLHPTIKPVPLMERIVLASSSPGDFVLDFFAGSGSTLVAAAKLGRNYLGCDLDPDYVKLALNRISELPLQDEG